MVTLHRHGGRRTSHIYIISFHREVTTIGYPKEAMFLNEESAQQHKAVCLCSKLITETRCHASLDSIMDC